MRPLPTGEPWGDYAVSTARWTGALLSDVLALAQPATEGVDVRFEGADHGPVPPRRRSSRRPTRTTSPSSARCPSPRRPTRPRTILVAYEMNGEPLRPDHGAPFRLIVPHWYAVASVKWLKRIDVLTEPYTGEFQTGHYIYQWPDRPHEAVTPHARARPHHRPRSRRRPAPRPLHGPREGLVGHRARSPRSTSASPARATGTRRSWTRRRAPTSGRTGRSSGTATTSDATPCAPGRPTPPATSNPTSRRGTGWATATTPSRSSSSTAH